MRRNFCLAMLSAAEMFVAAPADSQQTNLVGSFVVSSETDPFGDGETVVAIAGNAQGILALRCIQSTLSIGVATDSSIKLGDVFAVKIRASGKNIWDVKGTAVGDRIMQVDEHIDQIFDEIAGANSVAVRITGEASITYTVQTRQSAVVVARVRKACAPK